MARVIEVETAGALAMVQDLGRPGRQHLGVTPGGAMDRHAARMANGLVGNDVGAAVLEFALVGARLVFSGGCWVALTGATVDGSLAGAAFPPWRPVWVPGGTCLQLGSVRHGCRAYLAVNGGFDVPLVLGSRATDLRSGFGGNAGRVLRAGDLLAVGPATLAPPARPHLPVASRWRVAGYRADSRCSSVSLRLIPGPDWPALSQAERDVLQSGAFTVSAQADRMGLRLSGPPLRGRGSGARLSAGVAFGTVQLPASGLPIILGVDRQTTGGYPVLGTVASVDHSRIAQLRPGDMVRFEPISVAEAQARYRTYERGLSRLRVGLAYRWPLSEQGPCDTSALSDDSKD